MLECGVGVEDVDIGKKNLIIHKRVPFDLNNVGMEKTV